MNRLVNEHKYDDIINLPPPTSQKHPRMDSISRAAQFSPFAALTGYEAAVKETGRLTDRRLELDENEKAILNEKLQAVLEAQDTNPRVIITYFKPDERKDGGTYVSVSGHIRKIDIYTRNIVMKDGTLIPMDDVYEIDSDILTSL